MASVERWRDIRAEFESLAKVPWFLTKTFHPNREKPDISRSERDWEWHEPFDSTLRDRAAAIMLKAAKEMGKQSVQDWLEQLPTEPRLAMWLGWKGTDSEGEIWQLENVIEHSITRCFQFEAEAAGVNEADEGPRSNDQDTKESRSALFTEAKNKWLERTENELTHRELSKRCGWVEESTNPRDWLAFRPNTMGLTNDKIRRELAKIIRGNLWQQIGVKSPI